MAPLSIVVLFGDTPNSSAAHNVGYLVLFHEIIADKTERQ
jgi:hypothetical protein